MDEDGEPMVTLRLSLAHWRQIVSDIEGIYDAPAREIDAFADIVVLEEQEEQEEWEGG